jgi:hypothetical protein
VLKKIAVIDGVASRPAGKKEQNGHGIFLWLIGQENPESANANWPFVDHLRAKSQAHKKNERNR